MKIKLFFTYLKYKRKSLLILAGFAILFAVSFYLYRLPVKAVLYPAALSIIIGGVYLAADYGATKKRHDMLVSILTLPPELIDSMPAPDALPDEDYQKIIAILCEKYRVSAEQAMVRYNDMVDYYTVWAHQIKTPIASMRLTLQNEDTALSRKLLNDLARIESYVNMVLTFLRLESDSSDYVIQEYKLDTIVRTAVKKFSGEFIAKKLSLDYSVPDITVLTDEKWLSFVIEQVLSNAVKYTEAGGVSVYMEAPKTLCIRDTGIGISPEDLPRIFENGYTGFNGRMDKRASGIGLYLCKRICDNLGHGISAESTPGKGTTIRIALEIKEYEIE